MYIYTYRYTYMFLLVNAYEPFLPQLSSPYSHEKIK